jgi:hypothetical protein
MVSGRWYRHGRLLAGCWHRHLVAGRLVEGRRLRGDHGGPQLEAAELVADLAEPMADVAERVG